MLGYLIFLFGGMASIFALNVIFSSNDVLFCFLMVIVNFGIIFAMNVIVSLIVRAMPRRWLDGRKKIFAVRPFENKLYAGLGIKKWKDRVPELGSLAGFRKDKISALDKEYIAMFLSETCYAEVMHIFMLLVCFVDVLINPLEFALTFTFPLATIGACMNFPPILIQRYNRQKLLRLYQSIIKKEEMTKNITNGDNL